jgi:nucleotide-binding universal stress UspA family protein
MYKNILIPSEGSKTSENVIEFICSIQKVVNAIINIVYVVEVPRNLPLGSLMPEKTEAAKLAISAAENIAKKYDVHINTSIIYARTIEDTIITTAEDLRCDVIAIAQENQKLRIFSNTTSNIYQKAKCSVLLFNDKS